MQLLPALRIVWMRPLEQMPRSSDEQQAENSAMHGELEAEKMPTSARTLGDQFGIHRHSPGDLHAQERLKGFHPGRGTRYLLQKLSESGRETNSTAPGVPKVVVPARHNHPRGSCSRH